MKKIILVVLAITFHVSLIAQNTSVPYRVGNKFGISYLNGKMLIEPQFDIVKTYSYDNLHFDCFKLSQNSFLSSFIFNDKIVIKDKEYHTYYLTYNLIVATKLKSNSTNAIHQEYDSYASDYVHLYNLDGKIIFSKKYQEIFCSNLGSEKDTDEVLIYTVDAKQLNSLFLYDKKSKKIIKKFFENSDYFDVLRDSYNNEVVYIYKDVNKKTKQITLNLVNRKIKVISNKDYNLGESKSTYGSDSDASGYSDEITINPNAITKIKQIKINNKYNSFLKQIDKISSNDYTLYAKYQYMLEKEGKKGLYYTTNEEVIIPPLYDELIRTEEGCFILKKDNKYGIYINRDVTIEPIFDFIPMVDSVNYFEKNQPLIKLFDKNNTFFCYADKTGKLYYSER